MAELLQDANFWLLGSFLIFGFICYRFGKSALIGMLDARIQTIRQELQTAENLRVEAQELLAQYQRKHRDAVKEAESIVSKAEKQALEIRKQAEATLGENMARREAQLKERVRNMEQAAINEIQQYAANLSINATAQIIAEKLDPKVGSTLVERSIASVKKAGAR